MTITVEQDTRGIDALSGEPDDSITMPTLVWDQLVQDLGDVPPRPHIEPFDEQPWRQLPTTEELSVLWGASPVFMMMSDIVSRLEIVDLPKFLAEQRFRAELELAAIKEKEAADVLGSQQDPHRAGSGEHEPVGTSGTRRGGEDLSGGSEDSDTVVEGGQASGDTDDRRASQVPRKRRAGGSGKRRGVTSVHTNSAADTQAAVAPEVHGDHGDIAGGGDGADGAGDVSVAT